MPKNKLTPARVKVIRGVYEFVDILVSALLVIFLVFTFLFRLVGVEGGSMEPTLQEGDRLLVSSLRFKPEYKDIVIITQPNIFHEPIVKRVIATGGQTVDIDFEQGIVYVDGEALAEPYVNAPTLTKEGVEFPVTVPEGYLFVMGDNRNQSTDSRSPQIGFIDERYVLGKVECRLTPLGDWSVYDD
ncbi:MAG TPA: signal peptidase I [Candidatus Fimivicinus intestinavium]|nr:signal peptidase I [Candidatus Fimivicinus intestinavium]